MPDFNNMTGLGGYFSPEQLQEQQYGGGLFNPFYGQLAQSMYHGPSPAPSDMGGGPAPADMGGGQPQVGGWPDMGGGLPNAGEQQQSFNSPQFWQNVLASIGQPQNQPSPFVPQTYAEMVAQANPGGHPVTPPPTPTPTPTPAPAPSPVTQAAPQSNTGYSSENPGGGSDNGGTGPSVGGAGENSGVGEGGNGGAGGAGGGAHGGRILPGHHYGRAYNDHIHALQISADAAPPYANPTAAAGRRFQSS